MAEFERLTAKSPKNNMVYLAKVKDNEQDIEGAYDTLICIRESWEQLAAYEDLGSVEEFAQLKQDKDSYYTTFDGLREMIHELAGKLADYEEQAEMVNLLKTDGERRGNNE